LDILEAKGLTKNYGTFAAVRGIDLAIREGEVFGLLGPNGAGKTSTINILIGLAKITSGSAFVDGFDVTHHTRKAQAIMGVVADESNLNLCFCASLVWGKKTSS